MNILILENEIYLAQKISSRLIEDGNNCDFFETTSQILQKTKDYDIILLSTSLNPCDYKKIISIYRKSIIILLVSYISSETVTKPIKAGAKDYIMKPFVMDELVRKIYHYKECKKTKEEVRMLRAYVDFHFRNMDTVSMETPVNLPLMIETNSQKCAEKFAFDLSVKMKKNLRFYDITKENWKKGLKLNKKNIYFVSGFDDLKAKHKELLCQIVKKSNVILFSYEENPVSPFEKIKLTNPDTLTFGHSIMTINNYVKLMVTSFQDKYPDTELSKKLGISRKSLWEKRKKLEIEKKHKK